MSKRHQANRRKVYGRRQHEVRERVLRRPDPQLDIRVDGFRAEEADAFGFFDADLGRARFRFALAD